MERKEEQVQAQMEPVSSTRSNSDDAHIVWENPDTPITPLDYILLNGRRFVKPYFFEFIAHVKNRWEGKTIVDLYAHEFRQRPFDYYVEAVKTGRIRVNGNVVISQYVVRPSQTLSHFVHRHEPPVMADPVMILEISPDVVIVNKPPSIPVHPCGQYRKNTVVGILQAEHNLGPLYPIHRLDRLVSGLLILARNASGANRFRQQIEGGVVSKIYVARVQGVFPTDEVEVNVGVIYNTREGRSTIDESCKSKGSTKDVSVKKSGGKEGEGKHACTRFRRLAVDGDHTIVECVPITGRTHQIRVHLQYLGHPIANDALYASMNPLTRSQKGFNADKAARSEGEIIVEHKRQKICDEGINDYCPQSADVLPSDTCKDQNCNIELGFAVDHMCTHCPNLAPSGYEDDEAGLWLHCVQYSGEGWTYKCPLPKWACLDSQTIDET